MADDVILNESSVAMVVQSTALTYAAPSSGTDYIQVTSEAKPFSKNREAIERDTLSGTVETEATRVGIPEVSGSIPIELLASATAGSAPQNADVQLRAMLGGKKVEATKTATAATSTVITFASHSFTAGSCVKVLESGAHEIRPISAVTATTITFPFALDNGAPSATVVVEAVTTYYSDTTSAVNLSCEWNVGNEIQQQITDLTPASMTLSGWEAGKPAALEFSYEGVGLERSNASQSYTPDFTADAEPPVALSACLWLNGSSTSYNELGLSVENELAPKPDACQANGKAGSPRIKKQKCSFNANVYADDTLLTTWDLYNDNNDISVFYYIYNPSATAGEFDEAIAFWMPQGRVTAHPFGEIEGFVSDELVIQPHQSSGNDSIFISYV